MSRPSTTRTARSSGFFVLLTRCQVNTDHHEVVSAVTSDVDGFEVADNWLPFEQRLTGHLIVRQIHRKRLQHVHPVSVPQEAVVHVVGVDRDASDGR